MTSKTLVLCRLLALIQFSAGLGHPVAMAEEPKPELQFQSPEQLRENPNQDVNDILDASLNAVDENYRGQHQYHNDDLLGNFFAMIQHRVLNPFLNGLMAGNPVCLMVAAVLGVIAIGFLLRLGGKACDSMLATPAAANQAKPAIKN